MRYYITFQSQNFNSGLLSLHSSATAFTETTWTANEEELASTMARIDASKHKVIRIVKGVEVKFVQELRLLDDK
jgi:hypothetical protein